MPVNALLVRWAAGWVEVTDPAAIAAHGRQEATLGLGAVQSEAEARRIATAQLAIFADPRTQITAGVAPVDDTDRPYRAFGVGDRVLVPDVTGPPALQRVTAITGSEDDDGTVTYAPELADVIATDRERWQTTLDKMANGTLRGDTAVATPVSAAPALMSGPGPSPAASTAAAAFAASAVSVAAGSGGWTALPAVLGWATGGPVDGAGVVALPPGLWAVTARVRVARVPGEPWPEDPAAVEVAVRVDGTVVAMTGGAYAVETTWFELSTLLALPYGGDVGAAVWSYAGIDLMAALDELAGHYVGPAPSDEPPEPGA